MSEEKYPAIYPLVDALDLLTQSAYVEINNRIRAPLARTPTVSVNLAMSDHLFRAKAHGSADCQGPKYSIPLICLI